MSLRRASLAAAVLLGVVAAGCGSTASPSPQATAVERTVSASLADLSRADGRAFCSLMTASGRDKLAHTLHGYTCTSLMSMIALNLSPQQRAALAHVSVSGVTVRGDTALVSVTDLHLNDVVEGVFSPKAGPTELIRVSHNTWRIAA